jgi:hypothetical protein
MEEPEMTLQEVFNTIYTGMTKQQAYAYTHNNSMPGTCYYRLDLGGNNVLKCAVGMLIPDDKYHPSIEQKTVEYAIMVCGLHKLDRHLVTLTQLQLMHDTHAKQAQPFSQYLNALRDFALGCGLTIPRVQ